MDDDSVNYSQEEYNKYREIVEEINTDENLFIRKILSYFKFDQLLNDSTEDDTNFKYLLGYIPNPEIKYGNSEFIKFLTTPILTFAILIIIGIPLIDPNTKKVGLFWLVIFGLYACYTLKHCVFLSKLYLQFNTSIEYYIYQEKFLRFLYDSNSTSFFGFLVYNNLPVEERSKLNLILRTLRVFFTYGLLKLIQIASIPVLLFVIISLILDKLNNKDYKIPCIILLVLIFVINFARMVFGYKNVIKRYIYNKEEYNKEYDTYKDVNSFNWRMKRAHMLFSGGDSAFSSYLFTKTFTLIFGILMFIIGIPVYSIVLSLTLLYVSLNFIYNIVIFPLTKPETREKIFEIIKENGTLLALLFTGLTINSIYQSHIFGDNNKQIIGIMCAVYAILVLMHLGKSVRKTKNKTE